jgi:DNA-binding CsgD family transcriptional regulator
LTASQDRRAGVLDRIAEGGLSSAAAALELDMSERQLRRLRSAYQHRGLRGLEHGNHLRRPWNALSADVAPRVVELAATTYRLLTHKQLVQALAANEGIAMSSSTVGRILRSASQPVSARERHDPPGEDAGLQPFPVGAAAGPLTCREVQVLLLIAEGCANKQIANRLLITEWTVKTHVSSILRRLGAADRTHAAVMAVRLGLLA